MAVFLGEAETPLYTAEVKVLVQGGQTLGAPTLGDIQTSEALASTYSDLIKTRPVLNRVVQELDLSYDAESLSGQIEINSPRSFIEISVTDKDPNQAAEIANSVGQSFIDDFRARQLATIAQFEASLRPLGIEERTADIIAAQAAAISTLTIVEQALPPDSPSNSGNSLNIFLGALVGLLLAGLIVFLLEYLDNSIKSPEELRALTGLANSDAGMPSLGSVLRQSGGNGTGPIILTEEYRRTPFSESYKFLQTNLEFATLDVPGTKTILITSSVPGEGKTTTAANLSISMAREGKSVVLVDSDLRRPNLHKVFGIDNNTGLTNWVLGHANTDQVLTPTEIEGLSVVTSGPIPPDAVRVLRSPSMKQLVSELQERAEIVVFDSPPLLSVTDPMLMVPLVDVVILVVDADRTGREMVKRGAEILQHGSPMVVGTVLNKVGSRRTNYGGGYYYYQSYYEADGSSPENDQKNGRLSFLDKNLNRFRRKHRKSDDEKTRVKK